MFAMRTLTNLNNSTTRILLLVLGTIFTAASGSAQEIKLTSTPPVDLSNERIEPSGLVTINGSKLLVADDKQPGLVVIDSNNGKIVGEPLSVESSIKSPDWEAMARDPEGNLYLIGSRSPLVAFRFDEQAKKISPTIKPLDSKLEVEGLAVRKLNGLTEMSFGIRDRSGEIKIYRSLHNDAERLTLTPFFRFTPPTTEAVGWHLSSIEYAPELRGFLIITTTEGPRDNVFYGNRLWFVPDDLLPGTAPKPTDTFTDVKPLSSEVFEKEMKAEGMTVLSYDSERKVARLAIVYDNDFSWLTRNRKRIPGPAALPGKLQIVEVSLPLSKTGSN
jgi:hypothetical protein